MNVLDAMMHAAQSIISAKRGDYLEAAGHATNAALELVPHDQARKLLDEAIFRRVNAEAEIAEAAKFGLDEP